MLLTSALIDWSPSTTRAKMRSALVWHLLVTLLVAEWQWSLCGSTQISQMQTDKSLSNSALIRISLSDSSLENDALRRTQAAADGFDLANPSSSRAMPGQESKRMVLETTNSEVEALLAFKAGITSDPQGVLHRWSANDSDACSWQGVSCSSSSNHVAAIELADLQLHGTVSALLGQLSFLEKLDLSINNFTGFIPESLGNCSNLSSLNVSYNQIGGDIPAQLGQLENLLALDLSFNNLTGEIPASLGNCSLLEYLDLNTNLIGGGIPPQLGRLSSLQTLNLQSCFISGSVPSTLGNCTSLMNLRLDLNSHLGGELPSQLGELINLQHISAYGCILQGNFPNWVLNITGMQNLDLGFNQFYGEIPGDIGYQLPNLSSINLRTNAFTGEIPRSFVNNTALVHLILCENQLTGTLPPDIGLLRSLELLYVFTNFLTGIIPPSLSNCSHLTAFMVGENPFDPQVLPSWIGSFVNLTSTYFPEMNLYGSIPVEVGQLSQLLEFLVYANNLTGTVPASLGNCTSLNNLDIRSNQLSGELPPELGLPPILYLQIGFNLFPPGPFPAFILNLTMIELGIEGNQFNGRLDSYDFGKFGEMQILEPFLNDFEGPIPQSFANFSYLSTLNLGGNMMSGEIPPWLSNLTELGEVYLDNNQFSGSISVELLKNHQFTLLDFSANNLEGVIPRDIGLTFALQSLSLATNNLTGDIPNSLSNCTQLITLDLSQNRLSGSIPGSAFAMMASSLSSLNLSQNLLSGPWPLEFSQLINVQFINVSRNNISGSIPPGLGSCVALQSLDLSFNQLSGAFPQDLGSLQHLMIFNASYNNFEGSIPDSGAFKSNLTATSFLGNPGLCGGILGPQRQCPGAQAPSPAIGMTHNCSGFKCTHVWISVVAVVAFFISLVAAALVAYKYSRHRYSKQNSRRRKLVTFTIDPRMKFSKTDVLATVAAGEDNIIGKGANSTVYKAVLHCGETVAMKISRDLPGLSAGDQESQVDEKRCAMEFSNEAQTLAKLRHRNIVKVFGLCSVLDMKAIVLEYMPNGSLHARLHEHGPCKLTWAERLKIILGVTQGLVYLHHEFAEPIIHRDLKTSNILLDEEMEPKLCDFGISKNVAGDNGEATASTFCGTFGYLPPEYGTGAKVSMKGDVYSFGVVLLELLTAKKAAQVDSMDNFGQGGSLVSIVEQYVHESESFAFEVLDPALKYEGINNAKSRQQMMLSMQVALLCTKILPQNRPSMNVVREMIIQINELGEEGTAQRTLDDLLSVDSVSTSRSPDSNPFSLSTSGSCYLATSSQS